MSAVSTFPPASIANQLAELKRERKVRERVYAHLIATKKLAKETADYQNRGLDGAIATLEALVMASDFHTVFDVVKDARERLAAKVPG